MREVKYLWLLWIKKVRDCGAYQVNGLPCSHVLPCIVYAHHEIIDYIFDKLKKGAYLTTYEQNIKPLPNQSSWPTVDDFQIQSPEVILKIRRPKLKMMREATKG